ncbi:DDE superfamily endonuclease [Rhodovulum sp. ES.010]|uniref:transposase n=1 Tax=Rhodovulum sp. ES.010 TaxID=1882821 RepID=UPI000929DCAE|nr:transposase [Rhodovulum sp. ES.010]SIO55158.1 DDE superfamily endonuclease [Rhodovulum sp. ES.010]
MANHLDRLAFVDETSVKTNMARTTGWAPFGQRLVDHAPFGHWRTQTFVAALRHDRLDVTCHGIFPPPAIRVRPKEGTDNEANEIQRRADYRHPGRA